jgi:predicted nucleic acid-binding Zn ribbon protein
MKHPIPPARRSAALIAILCSFVLLLSACGGSIETDLTLYTGDRFEATSRITTSVEGLMLVGGAETIEAQLREVEQQAVSENARFSWGKERSRNANEVVYRITVGGTGYEKLANLFGIDIQKTKYRGQDALSISAEPNYDLSDMQNTVRLHVGKILQTDNQRSGNNTIVWTGTERLQAIVTPASSTNWPTILLLVLALAAVAVGALIVWRRRPAGQVAAVVTATPAAAGGFCPACGQPIQPGARFCMHCGQALPPRGG